MKRGRTLLLIVIAGGLGVLTTLTIAWSVAALRSPITSYSGRVVEAKKMQFSALGSPTLSGIVWDYGDQHRFGERTFTLMCAATVDLPKTPLEPRPSISTEIDWFLDRAWARDESDEFRGMNVRVTARTFGWPTPCLWYGIVGNKPYPQEGRWTPHGYGAMSGGRTSSGIRLLPMRPLWPQIILDSAVFTGVWLAVIAGTGWVVRRRRRRAGQCARCGYDLTGLPTGATCPECGGMFATT